MDSILENYKFIQLNEFLKDKVGIEVGFSDIYIKLDNSKFPIIFSTDSKLTSEQILEKSRNLADFRNQIKIDKVIKKLEKQFSIPNEIDFVVSNTTNINFLTNKWRGIFKSIGDDLSIFILTKCHLVERVNNKLFYLAGNIFSCWNKNHQRKSINRKTMLNYSELPKQLNPQNILNKILVENLPKLERLHILNVIIKMCSKFNKIPMHKVMGDYEKSILKKGVDDKKLSKIVKIEHFNSLVTDINTLTRPRIKTEVCRKDAVKKIVSLVPATNFINEEVMNRLDKSKVIDPEFFWEEMSNLDKFTDRDQEFLRDEKVYTNQSVNPSRCILDSHSDTVIIVNFLFIISKKFLNPVFTYSEFLKLKGKLKLLIFKNLYEDISMEELKLYFSISSLKLFPKNKSSKEMNITRTVIFENLLNYLVENIFIPLTLKEKLCN